MRARIVESGPVRVTIELGRRAAGSTFTQRIRLAAGGAGGAVEFDTRVDWQSPRTLLKAAFHLAVKNARATYDLGIATIERGNNHETLYEVPAQQWADITAEDGRYGVAVLEDSKCGWDKPDDGTLRLTLIHGPHDIQKDRGRHRFLYALAGHEGDWRQAKVQDAAARLNQPLLAFQAPAHEGPLGKRFSMVRLSADQVAISALKKAEDGDEIVVRLFERHGRPAPDVKLSFAAPVLAVREVSGIEMPIEESSRAAASRRPGAPPARDLTVDQGAVRLSMDPYRPRTIAVKLAAPKFPRLDPPAGVPVRIPFDTDVISLDEDRSDGDFDGSGHSLPGELLPREIVSEGIRFEIGPNSPGAKNAVTCRGQQIDLPPGDYDRLYILAAARGGDATAAFSIGDRRIPVSVQDFTAYVGQSQSLVVDGRILPAERMDEPFIKDGVIAWIGTHRHSAKGGNEPYVFTYLFKLAIPVPPGEARPARLTLPQNDAIRILAITTAHNPNDATTPASEAADRFPALRIRPRGGLAIEPVSVSLSCDRADAILRYTVNGLEPVETDTLYTGPFVIDRDATVRARAFLGGAPVDDVATRTFRFAKPRAAGSPGRVEPGLDLHVYEGSWRDLSGLASSKPVKTSTAVTISTEPRTRDLDFGLEFTGWIDVPSDGAYTFYTQSDDGSTLWIGDTLVVDNDGLHGSTERSGSIALARGKHPIKVLYFQKGGDIDLQVNWEGPGITKQPIPAPVLWRKGP